MRIAYNNKVDALTSTSIIISSAVVTGYSILNTQDERLGIMWHSDAVSVQTILFEMPIFTQYPDNSLTGISYFNEDWTSTDSFITSGASALVVSNGTLIANYNAIRPIAITSASSFCFVKIKSTEGTTSFSIYQGSTSYSYLNASLAAGVWNICGGSTTIVTVTSNIVFIDNVAIGNHFVIDWAYVGSGSFTALSFIEDISDNGYNGIPTAIISEYDSTIEGRVVHCFGFSSSNVIASTPSLSTEDDISISGWINISSLQVWDVSNKTFIMSIGDDANSFGINKNTTDGQIQVSYADGSSAIVSCSVASIIKDTWIHVAAVYNGKTTKKASLFINGVLQATTITSATSLQSFDSTFNIGGNTALPSNFGNGLHMKFHDVRLYRRVLSSNEVNKLYSKISFMNEDTSLILRFDLNENNKIKVAGILGHNIKSGTKILIEANDSNAWNDSEISQEMVSYPGNILYYFSTYSIYKYWKFSIYQASLEIGRFWLSDYLTITPSSVVDFEINNRNSDRVSINDSRQKFGAIGTAWREIKLSFPKSEISMIESIIQMYNEVGKIHSVIFCNFDTIRDYNFIEPMYSVLDGDLNIKVGKNLKSTYDLKVLEVK